MSSSNPASGSTLITVWPGTPYPLGATYDGRVVNITKFGAFVNILPGRDGLLHISKIGGGKRIDRVEDVLELGQEVEVQVEDIDPNGKISLRMVGDQAASGNGGGDRIVLRGIDRMGRAHGGGEHQLGRIEI